MKTLYGITKIQVAEFTEIDDLNEFLLEYDGNIIEIQSTPEKYIVIYKYMED